MNLTCTRTLNKIRAVWTESRKISLSILLLLLFCFCFFSLDLLFKLCTLTLYLFVSHTVGSSLLKSITNFSSFKIFHFDFYSSNCKESRGKWILHFDFDELNQSIFPYIWHVFVSIDNQFPINFYWFKTKTHTHTSIQPPALNHAFQKKQQLVSKYR